MAIRNIRILDEAGNQLAVATRSLTVSAGPGTSAVPEPSGITLQGYDSESIYARALEQMDRSIYLSNINGVMPDGDGQFWISGDACLSWKPDNDDVKTYVVHPGTINEVYNLEKGGGLTLYDLCPACLSCDPMLQLKHGIEAVKIAVNQLKDVNLYAPEVCLQRKTYLDNQRLSTPVGCTVPADDLDGFSIDSKRLLGQYATAVHMWNYVVSQYNAKTTIDAIASDPSGFTIQTKRAVPSCDGKVTIQCEVEISCRNDSGGANDGMSVYIPTPTIMFMPFDRLPTDVGNPATIVADASDYTHKIIRTNFKPVTAAGTYALIVQILPFRYTKLLDSNNQQLSLENIVYTPSHTVITEKITGVDTETYTKWRYDMGVTRQYGQILAPTLTDYNTGKSYPSKSCGDNAIWDIYVKWTVTGLVTDGGATDTAEFEETYVFVVPQPRKYLDGLFNVTKLIKVNRM